MCSPHLVIAVSQCVMPISSTFSESSAQQQSHLLTDCWNVQIRLNEVYDVVDHIVLVESATTHQNQPKPLHYAENAGHFSRFADKIVHVALDDLLGEHLPEWFTPLQVAFQKYASLCMALVQLRPS